VNGPLIILDVCAYNIHDYRLNQLVVPKEAMEAISNTRKKTETVTSDIKKRRHQACMMSLDNEGDNEGLGLLWPVHRA
jgi:NAD-dependent DNA ligase